MKSDETVNKENIAKHFKDLREMLENDEKMKDLICYSFIDYKGVIREIHRIGEKWVLQPSKY